MSLPDTLFDAVVGRVLVRLGHLFLVKAVVLGFGSVQDGAVRGGKTSAGMADVGVVDPDVVVHGVGVFVQVLDAQVSVLPGVVDEK